MVMGAYKVLYSIVVTDATTTTTTTTSTTIIFIINHYYISTNLKGSRQPSPDKDHRTAITTVPFRNQTNAQINQSYHKLPVHAQSK